MTYVRPEIIGNITRLPNYFMTTSFERNHDTWAWLSFVDQYWTLLFYVIPSLYVIFVFGGPKFMASRKPFGLRKALCAWDVALSILSFFCTIRIAHHTFHILFNYGLYPAICDNSTYETDRVSVFWITMYTIMKVADLGDTAFIVLRKTPLIFLHWYHHVISLLYVLFSCSQLASHGRWLILLNSSVHILMYGYYAAKAMRYKVARVVPMAITSLQILEMVAGIYVNYMAYYYLKIGSPCGVSKMNIIWSFWNYLSFFLLFSKFFYDAYLKKSSSRAIDYIRNIINETVC